MSLANFSFPYQLAATPPYVFPGSQDPQSAINNLRLNAVPPPTRAPSFNNDQRYNNEPYIPPARYQQQHQLQQQRQREQQLKAQESYAGHHHTQHQVQNSFPNGNQDTRYANYNQDFRRTQPRQQQVPQQQQIPEQQQQQQQQQQHQEQPSSIQRQPRLPIPQGQEYTQQNPPQDIPQNGDTRNEDPESYPGSLDDGYTRVSGRSFGSSDTKTSVHAILDYDDDDDDIEDYYDDADPEMPNNTRVTPIQGPIYVKNGSVPVVPLFSYPQLNNGSFVQIPIFWTALSLALGVELRGDLVKGAPCIKRHHQLYCPTAGKAYPTERIEHFIDENKALMKRMYGVFEMDEDYGPPTRQPGRRKRRNAKAHGFPDGGPNLHGKNDDGHLGFVQGGDSIFRVVRKKRQSSNNSGGNETGRVDSCESESSIIMPYWAKNSASKKRAIVNTQHFEQAIHQETCTQTRTSRCKDDCGCEQKYKWHRLLAYDPDDDCKGIFMDWFIYPSCCVCRCDPKPGASIFTSGKNHN